MNYDDSSGQKICGPWAKYKGRAKYRRMSIETNRAFSIAHQA